MRGLVYVLIAAVLAVLATGGVASTLVALLALTLATTGGFVIGRATLWP